MNICLERTLSFHTLNKHLLLVKHDSEKSQSLTKIMSRARVHVPDAIFLEFKSFYYYSNGVLKDFNCR